MVRFVRLPAVQRPRRPVPRPPRPRDLSPSILGARMALLALGGALLFLLVAILAVLVVGVLGVDHLLAVDDLLGRTMAAAAEALRRSLACVQLRLVALVVALQALDAGVRLVLELHGGLL